MSLDSLTPVIGVAADHAAHEARLAVIQALMDRGFQVRDFGAHEPVAMDYPDSIVPCARALSHGEVHLAVVLCGSGIGASICANKLKGVRCALCLEVESARLSRLHNDSNCLALAGRMRSVEENLRILATWLDTSFEGGRHTRRLEKLHGLTGC
ncbi:MAG: RpiB/LacA/LacB family sugar-phosphate isomerase [Calditrichaeota bacterium]|nr:RpiB/LacA/LacB family sugar-phosphate isomerase [Candidatus Cloacimonadota bacterium]MCA9787113.1 RpiB/LacA/LacB family sugar-phosphate isomerase [Candidatus Cloacimonadota bacterium]MCB1046964.1 RpiB/LacA/LacB family sugar-phosphate isomerase [Calditrichota bacterium]MCB9472228.1 RpiB/LacA/LacB family sugar-phosphate isomerase [Candidatus Delongbacteria bacterium]MCB9475190.1 RpiB/LacA/LacB family sugar-phosphate isomerase [Candidatus Delongbacteria bacterium]